MVTQDMSKFLVKIDPTIQDPIFWRYPGHGRPRQDQNFDHRGCLYWRGHQKRKTRWYKQFSHASRGARIGGDRRRESGNSWVVFIAVPLS